MKIKNTLLGALAGSLLLVLPAYGGGPQAPVLIEGANGIVDVLEFDTGYGVEYMIDVVDDSSSVEIDFFAISNNSPGGRFYSEHPWFLPNGGTVLAPTLWDAMYGAAFGSFSSLFSTDLFVSVFDGQSSVHRITGDDQYFWLDNAIPASQFVVANNGAILDQSFKLPSNPTGVPDGGSTFALLGIALCGLLVRARRLRR